MPNQDNTQQNKEEVKTVSSEKTVEVKQPEQTKVEDTSQVKKEETPLVKQEEIKVEKKKDREEIPPKELNEKLTLDDFLGEMGKPKEETEKKEEKKEEVKKEVVVKQEEKKQEETQVDGRDYSDLPENVQPLFKKMSNEAFNYFKPLFKESERIKQENENLKKGSKHVPESYYRHPNAYVLLPEFQEAAQREELNKGIYNHWVKQLTLCRSGKDWQDLSFDEKSGKFVLSEPQAANPDAESAIISMLTYTQQELSNSQVEKKALIQTFQETHENSINFVKESETKYFKEYQDEKHPMRPTIQKVINALPPMFRDDPLINLFAYTVANNIQLRALLDQQNKEKDTKKSIDEDKKKAGPNQTVMSGINDDKKDKEFSLDDFVEAMR